MKALRENGAIRRIAFSVSDSQLAVLLAFAAAALVIPAIVFIGRDWKYETGRRKSNYRHQHRRAASEDQELGGR